MKPGITLSLLTILALLLVPGCEEFLDTKPIGPVSLSTLASNENGAESLLISAYSVLDGYIDNALPDLQAGRYVAAASNWVFGSIAGGDAYKGSTDGDQTEITDIEKEKTLAVNSYPEGKWRIYFEGINRANTAIRAFKGLTDPAKSKEHRERIAEARFLRGFFHYELWKIFHRIPYVSDTLADVRVGNQKDVLPSIQEDFEFAAAYLPLSQPAEPGRITQGAAKSYLGITWMWSKEWANAKALFDEVINSGQYALNPKYHDNFNPEIRNTPNSTLDPESILAVQLSVNDGSADGGNGNFGDQLNYPIGSPFGCCGFHQPSQNLVNAFKTDANGLPLLDTYNDSDVTNDQGLLSTDPFTPYSGNLDPRLDWTVGRRGIPFLDWGKHPGNDWIASQIYGGPYSPLKNIVSESQMGTYSQANSWANLNSNNIKLLRYADLLLYAAEAEVELGDLSAALHYVNMVRIRAANTDGFVMDGTVKAANYWIDVYSAFPDKDFARQAVRFERRIELGMEGHRFFDLVRWGVAASEKNKYFATESTKRSYLLGAVFIAGKNEYMPIPQRAIDLSSLNGQPTLTQNDLY